MKRKQNKLNWVRDKRWKIKVAILTSSCLQFCFKGGERFTCLCFICKAVPNAYTSVGKAFLSPKMSLTGEYEDLFLSFVAPYFAYQTAYEIILLDIQTLQYGEAFRRFLWFLYESVAY